MLTDTISPASEIKARQISALSLLILCALALAAFVVALVPINSNDFWWHLKTGDYIRATGALPTADPFSYFPATDPADTALSQVILRRYWLAQVFYSLIHGSFGLSGILVARAVLYAAMVLAAAVFLWRRTRSYLGMLPLLPLILSLRVALEDSDRPHQLAFFSVLVVVLLLEGCVRTGRYRWLYLLPPLQLIAAQLHPGFAVGSLIVVIYTLCAGFEPRLRELQRLLWRVTGLCLFFFLLNPNGLKIVPYLLGSFPSGSGVFPMEFVSPLKIWRHVVAEPGWQACWGLLFLTVPVICVLFMRRCWSAALVLLGLMGASLAAMRYLGFFVPVAAVFIGLELARLGAARMPRRGEGFFAMAILVASTAILIAPGHVNRGKIRQQLQPGYFPVAAADFLERQGAPDNFFNFDAWGGYLEYRLWPRHQVFSDTRFLSSAATADYLQIISATPSGVDLLQRHRINTVVFPSLDIYSGEVYPLVRRLSDDPQWSLVHFDDTALVFARQPHGLPALAKDMIWFQVLRQVDAWQPRFSWVSGYQRTRAEATMRMRGSR